MTNGEIDDVREDGYLTIQNTIVVKEGEGVRLWTNSCNGYYQEDDFILTPDDIEQSSTKQFDVTFNRDTTMTLRNQNNVDVTDGITYSSSNSYSNLVVTASLPGFWRIPKNITATSTGSVKIDECHLSSRTVTDYAGAGHEVFDFGAVTYVPQNGGTITITIIASDDTEITHTVSVTKQ